MLSYIHIDCGQHLVRVYSGRRDQYIDTAVGAIFDAWARREYGPKAMVYSYRRESWNGEGTTYSVSVVENRAYNGAWSVLGNAQLYLSHEDVQRADDFLGIHRAF